MKHKHSRVAWIPVGLLWILFLTASLWLYLNHPNGAGDFQYYYRGIERIRSATPLYENLQTNDYVGPPLQIQLMTLLFAFTPNQEAAERVWFGVNVLVLIVTLAILSRYIHQHHRLILWLATPLFAPVLYSFWLGQITIVLFALTAGAWAAYKAGKPALTGALLALAVWTKFYPGLFLLYFVWKRDWRVVIGGAVMTVLVVLVQVTVSGGDTFIYYLLRVLPALAAEGQPALNHSNNAILGFAQKLFSESPQIIPLVINPMLVTVTRYGLTLAIFSVTLYLISRPLSLADTSSEKFDLEYAAVLLVALLAGSTLGVHGMLSTLLVFVILFRDRYGLSSQTRTRLRFLGLFAASLINIHVPIILGYLQPPSTNMLPALALSLPFFGMMLLWGMVAVVLFNQRRAAALTANIRTAPATGSRSP